MRLYCNANISTPELFAAAQTARASLVYSRFTPRSSDYAVGWSVTLTGESRRRPNDRGRHTSDEYAATWDQWGVFLAALFALDPDMVCGSPKRPVYENGEDFANLTCDRFGAPEDVMTSDGYVRVFESYGWPEDAHGDHSWGSGTFRTHACRKCSAVHRRTGR